MSLKLSDLKAAKAERFPDFILDATDEEGNELELHFRPALVLDDKLRAELKTLTEKLDEAGEDADALEYITGILRIVARDPYHFEVLQNYVAENDDEGDDPMAMWTTIIDLYREQTHLGEA